MCLSQDHIAVMTHIISFLSGGETKKAPTKPVLKDLMDALYHEVADKWKAIGVLLELMIEMFTVEEGFITLCRMKGSILLYDV